MTKEKQLIHVDHFIPWSYLFEDELWNLVLACRKCNLQKHSSLPPEKYVRLLTSRNTMYFDQIEGLKRSIQRLDDRNHERAVFKHYKNCKDYGFTEVSL